MVMTDKQKIRAALEIAMDISQIDGDHHKAYAIDQMIRALLGDQYEAFVVNYSHTLVGQVFEWGEGIAP